MFKWISNLFRGERAQPRPVIGAGLEPYPTPETVCEWDDASLFSAAGCAAALRYHQEGFENLNESAKCVYDAR